MEIREIKEQALVSEVAENEVLTVAFYRKETVWHRNWKLAFPESFREVGFRDVHKGDFHRADIFTPSGHTIEFQNSPINLAELRSREAFYPNLIWVLNGKKFKGFKILKHLPDIDDPRLKDYEFRSADHLSLVRKCDVLSGKQPLKVLNFYHPELKDIKFSSNYYSFCWKNSHSVWYEATVPIIIDLGGHFLYELKTRHQLSGDYYYLKLLHRKTFIYRYTPPEY
ncbi:competence protein CoiA family protein [Pedobacter endophyticus]|uniref:competence protein n=1 Tax=Pedobacter endophyticus TaxID=2789740 RepID=UPI001E3A28D7|nr:competence protein [Pedobacter endophyticus]